MKANTPTPTNSEIREEILDCFKRTKIQQEGDTELFDTDVTIDLIQALINKQIIEARIDEVNGFMKLHTGMQPDRSGSYLWLKSRLKELRTTR